LCGAIFDVPHYREQLRILEKEIAQPDFWSNQEKAQSVLRERKRAEDQIAAEARLDSLTGDIETYIHLAHEETNRNLPEHVRLAHDGLKLEFEIA